MSPTEEERKKEKSRFLTVPGSVCRRLLWKVPLCVLVVFHTQVTIMTVRRLDFVHRLRYFRFVLYYIYYGQSGPSLLIESTDSMILIHVVK